MSARYAASLPSLLSLLPYALVLCAHQVIDGSSHGSGTVVAAADAGPQAVGGGGGGGRPALTVEDPDDLEPGVTFSNSTPALSVLQISPKAIVSDACASYSTLERLNKRVRPALEDLTQTTDFFSHYRLNLFHKRCPFWDDQNGMCGNVACAVQTLDNEEDIPLAWRAAELGRLEGPRAKHPGRAIQRAEPERPLQGRLGEDVGESCVVEYDDECDERDYCVPEDESATGKGDYVSLLQNPERFTGYAGDGARQVWDAIYRENCFQRSSFPGGSETSSSPATFAAAGLLGGSAATSPPQPAANDFRNVLEAAGRQQKLSDLRASGNPNAPFVAQTGLEAADECLEKRVFYRVVSGMHASISTHLCWNFLNQTTGQWMPNPTCYIQRLHRHPDRISNLYFNYALVTRAVAKIGPYLVGSGPSGTSTTGGGASASSTGGYTFCSGDPEQDRETRAKVLEVVSGAASVPHLFDESLMFQNGEGPSLKEDFRNRFRNVSRLMDCVGCDKCRLWGKLQTAGYGTALKILFEFDNAPPTSDGKAVDVPHLKRTELVALFNTYARLSQSINAIGRFREMVDTDPETGEVRVREAVLKAVVEELDREREAKEAKKAKESNKAKESAKVADEAVKGKAAKDLNEKESIHNQQTMSDQARKSHHVVDDSTSLDDDDDVPLEDAQKSKRKSTEKMTFKEEFVSELMRVVKAYQYVLTSWLNLPWTL